MEDPGFTLDQLRKLVAMRPIISKIMRGPNPEKEIVAWAMRGGKAEVIQLEHDVFDWNRGSQSGRFLIQAPCWSAEASMDDAPLFGRHP